jgi:uncharacterized protein YoxC
MLTKDDKKFIIDSIKSNNDVLVKDMLDLFNATNAIIKKVDDKLNNKIDQTNERIDRILDQLQDDDESINDHEKRMGKIEDRVFPISA